MSFTGATFLIAFGIVAFIVFLIFLFNGSIARSLEKLLNLKIRSKANSKGGNYNYLTKTSYNNYLGGRLISTKRKEVSPIIGYKRLNINVGFNKAWFQSPNHQQAIRLGIVATATCSVAQHKQEVPFSPCTCGFYSFKDSMEAYAYLGGDFVVKLVNSGKYLEFEEGWRSNTQRVTEIYAPDRCVGLGCSRKNPPTVFASNYRGELMALCTLCAKERFMDDGNGGDFITFDELPQLLILGVATEEFRHQLPVVITGNHVEALTRKQIKDWSVERKTIVPKPQKNTTTPKTYKDNGNVRPAKQSIKSPYYDDPIDLDSRLLEKLLRELDELEEG